MGIIEIIMQALRKKTPKTLIPMSNPVNKSNSCQSHTSVRPCSASCDVKAVLDLVILTRTLSMHDIIAHINRPPPTHPPLKISLFTSKVGTFVWVYSNRNNKKEHGIQNHSFLFSIFLYKSDLGAGLCMSSVVMSQKILFIPPRMTVQNANFLRMHKTRRRRKNILFY